MRLEVEPAGYTRAADPLRDAGQWVEQTLDNLRAALASSAAMAGTDSGGQGFATSYDVAAGSAAGAGAGLATSFHRLSALVATAAHNHGAAEAASRRGGGTAPPPPSGAGARVTAFSPPSAMGGSGESPDWWHYVLDHAEGLVWPNADTGELRSAGQAWQDAARSLMTVTGQCDEAVALLGAQRTPEAPHAQAAVRRLGDLVGQLSRQYSSLGQACARYADHVDSAREQSTHIMEGVLAGLAITAVVGIGLTLVTFGGSDAAAAAAASAEVAAGAEEVAGVLTVCAEAAGEGAAVAGDVATTAVDIKSGLAPFEAAEPELAEVTAVEGTEGGADGATTGPRQVFRADTRDPETIFRDGFQPKGSNTDLTEHVTMNPANSNFVSTTHSMESAENFAGQIRSDYIYQAQAEGIDVNATLGESSPFPWENEIAVPGGIPGEAVEGVWGPEGWIPNPAYLP
ncbi:scabin-related ADP-ribosyltransferase [Nocardioides panaciterrulae]|uniref:Uncharacterized protein n=1 Tax=Nocardioides panaciterrulae TaxID=661492 RepID=A0A7Y9E8C2_9ACTN|nr:enterotoxin A family protein [Nocardioides panaciterrulae]NYD43093.1 hypothetical protein [Nocardioides panaciterrulae]